MSATRTEQREIFVGHRFCNDPPEIPAHLSPNVKVGLSVLMVGHTTKRRMVRSNRG
jgi:hypothetical protein